MEIKRLISHFVYRIEARPGGGFIARATDPAVPPIEAATREELQQKIRATISERLATDFGLKLPTDGNSDFNLDFHIEHKPEGGFTIHSADPKAQPIEIDTHEGIEGHIAEKLIPFLGKHFSPELARALNTPGGSGDVKVSVARKTFSITAGSRTVHLDRSQGLPSATAMQSDESKALGGTISNAPITPEGGGNSTFFRWLLALAVIGALVYVFLHYR